MDAREDDLLHGVGQGDLRRARRQHDALFLPPHQALLLQREHELLDEERVALGLVEDERLQHRWQLVDTEQAAGHPQAVLARQRGQRDGGVEGPAATGRSIPGPARHQDDDPAAGDPVGHAGDPVLGRRITPVDVLEDDDVWARLGGPVQQLVDGLHDGGMPLARVHRQHRRIAGIERQ
jgi:hypothetical protein